MDAPLLTAEEYWRHPGHKHSELIRGRIVDTPPHGAQHGFVVVNLGTVFREYAKSSGGAAARCGFVLQRNPDTVLGPDLAYLSEEQASKVKSWKVDSPEGSFQHDWPEFPPVLAIEIRDFNEHQDLEAKTDFYLAHGTQAVWLVEPRRRAVTMHRPACTPETFTDCDIIPGGEILPGFELPVADIFA